MSKKSQNKIKKWFLVGFASLLVVLLVMFSTCRINPPLLGSAASEKSLPNLQLPDGFEASIYASKVTNARAMSWGKNNVLFVGSRSEGKLYAISDVNNDGTGDEVITIAQKLHMPTGIAYHDGDLYVSEVSRILVFRDIDKTFKNSPQPEALPYEFPKEEHHGWKYLKFGPDQKLYVSLGAPCNVCETPEDERFASILRMDKNASNVEIFARGVRNSVGFDWNPKDQVLFFTENGRDWMGDDMPPCELNKAEKPGLHFGFPYCHAGQYPDTEYKSSKTCADFEAPFQNLGPHVAPLGMLFYTGKKFPEKYKNGILIAEHGSWNRTNPIGYRISFVGIDSNGKSTGYETFAQGWLQENGKRWGRPADLIMHPDGSILVSDDFGDAIYKISYNPKN